MITEIALKIVDLLGLLRENKDNICNSEIRTEMTKQITKHIPTRNRFHNKSVRMVGVDTAADFRMSHESRPVLTPTSSWAGSVIVALW